MALTPEAIKANEALQELPDEQVTAIATLSANDENTVINAKIGELHGRYDSDVKEVAGIEKKQGEKSYDYVKRVLGEFKTKVESSSALTDQIGTYKTKVADLEAAIADGKGNEAVTQKLKDTQSKLDALQGQYDTDKQAWETEKGEYSDKITGIQVKSQFEKATSGLQFKAGYPDSVQETLLKAAQDGILSSFKPDWVESDGKQKMVFRDESGEVLRNKNNLQEPYTAEELIRERLKDVLDTGKKTPGGGTKKPGEGSGGGDSLVDLAGAKSQVEADEIIVKQLMSNGLTRGSAAFSEEQAKLRKENAVSKLPLR